jgi:hypothetical protein
VSLKGEEDKELLPGYNEEYAEIQVRSAIADVWAAARHGILYKALGGYADTEARKILDSLRGLAQTGEVLMGHLHDIHEKRKRADKEEFENEEVFQYFLLHLEPLQSPRLKLLGDIGSLYNFVQILHINTPGLFKDRLRKSKFEQNFRGSESEREIFDLSVCYFILYHIFVTCSYTEVDFLFNEISKSPNWYKVLCRSVEWLEAHHFH